MEEPKEDTLPWRCWNKFKEESLPAQYSRFFISLAAGDLPLKEYKRCTWRDIEILKAFAIAYQSAMNYARNDYEKKVMQHLEKRAQHEIKIYQVVAKKTSAATTDEYIKYLRTIVPKKVEMKEDSPKRKVALSEEVKTKEDPCKRIVVHTLAAIAPCMRLYFHLYKQIQNMLQPADKTHKYRIWIDYYISQDFQDSIREIENKMNSFSVAFSAEEVKKIEDIYQRAMWSHVQFFKKIFSEAGQVGIQIHNPLLDLQELREHQFLIFFNYETMTCATKNPNCMLALARISRSSYYSDHWKKTWKALSSQRAEDVKLCVARIFPAAEGRYDEQELHEFLESFADYEKEANNRVERSRLLFGLGMLDIQDAAKETELQNGCERFFEKIVKNRSQNTDLHIISCCWSGELIRSFLSNSYPDADVFNVHSNELDYDEVFITTGDLERNVESAIDKLVCFGLEFSKIAQKETMTVYIGGDVNDLLCMLEANIGIAITPSEDLMTVGERFGVEFVPLFVNSVKSQKQHSSLHNLNPQPGILYTASCWAEVEAFLLGL